jgi:CHAT domain-containing protein
MVNKSILSNIELSNLPTSVSTKSAIHPQIFLNSLLSKSDILYNLYQNKTLKRKHLTAALALLFQCDTLVDALRKIKTNSADKLALGSLSERVYESGVQLSLALADVSLSSKKYNELAFYFNEKSKAAILLEAIADTKAKGFAGLPDYVLLKEQNLKSDLSYLEQQLAKAIPGTEIYYNLKAKYKSVDDEYQNFIKKLEVEYPSYYQLKYSQKIVSVSDLQAKLNKKEALISYLEAKDKTYIFEISKSNLRITEKEKTEQVEKNIKGLRNSILHQDTELYSDLGFQLFKQYAEPIIKYEHVVLIPSGRLASIPFETLLTSKIKRKTLLKDYPYLIKKTAVSSQFSASIFLQNYSNNITTTDIKALVCAPISFSSHTQYALSELPGTKSEAAALTQLFTKNNISTDQVLSENVTETWIKSTDLNKYNYLHLATHGTVDENKPELSQIFLVKDKQNDGNLYSGEIFNLKLNARLVTLSACQTGLGKIAKGEGMIGLSRSLLYAGAQNMVVSLWTVNDSSTSQLMNSFYTHLLNDKNTDLSKALRIAKLEMINSDGFSAPYFWAPFVLVGR